MDSNATFSAFVPYSTHVADDVIRTVGGEFLMVWRIGGIPYLGVDPADLQHRHRTLNRWLQSLRAPDSSNIAFWTHEVKRKVRLAKQEGVSQKSFSGKMERTHLDRLSAGQLLQTHHYLTIIYRPSARQPRDVSQHDILEAAEKLRDIGTGLEKALTAYAPVRLRVRQDEKNHGRSYSEILEFFGVLINRVSERTPVFRAPIHAGFGVSRIAFAKDGSEWVSTAPSGERMIGAMLSVKEFPEQTVPGQLNALKSLPFEYVLTQSFSPLGRYQGLRALDRTKGRLMSSGDKSVSQIDDLDKAMDQLSSGQFLIGEFHFSLALSASSRDELNRNIAEARAVLTNLGFISVREDMGSFASFFAQLPANWRYRPRISLLSSLNFAGLSPFHAGYAGKASGNPWGNSIAILRGNELEPFHFNFHVTPRKENALGQMVLANTLVIGKSGTGKTALVNFLLGMARNLEPAPRLFMFDKDHGAALFVKALGGTHFGLTKGLPSGLNPLQVPDAPGRIEFLMAWLCGLAGREFLSPTEERELEQAVRAVLDADLHLRTLSNLQRSLPNRGDDCLHAQLRRWTEGQVLGWVFDNPFDRLDIDGQSVFAFDCTEVLDDPALRNPIVQYLLYRLESSIDGERLIYVMDEFWKILDGDSGLRDFARNKQKTIRKQNGLGIFATQSPEDALRSPIATAIIEQTATMILLPNPSATKEEYVEGLKLSDSEFELVRSLDEHSRKFLIKQGENCALCELDLSGMPEILPILSTTTEQMSKANSAQRNSSMEAL